MFSHDDLIAYRYNVSTQTGETMEEFYIPHLKAAVNFLTKTVLLVDKPRSENTQLLYINYETINQVKHLIKLQEMLEGWNKSVYKLAPN